jgi:STE24 endopeptidase
VNEGKSTRYHRLKRRAAIASAGWSVALLGTLIVSGAALRLRAMVTETPESSPLVAVGFVAGLALLHEVGALPIGFFGGFLLDRRYGLSHEPLGVWLFDQFKSLLLTLVIGSAAAWIIYFFIARFPDAWWLPAGVVFALLAIVLARVTPVLILPLFFRIKPLAQESLRARLVALADRAGAHVLGAYEWGLAARTRRANAALAGIGATRRILVSDTMLQDYSDDEIEVVLAHELAHHVHGDIWKAIALESMTLLVAFQAASQVLRFAVPALGLAGPADIAGLPVILLVCGFVMLVTRPATFALSRSCERSADRFALELTRNPAAFVSAMRRLGAQNLAEDEPSRFIQWLFYSHPPFRERIAAAQSFRT